MNRELKDFLINMASVVIGTTLGIIFGIGITALALALIGH
jgi:hypothetical protein